MALRWVRNITPLLLLFAFYGEGCVSPVELPTDREVEPPVSSVALSLEAVSEIAAECEEEADTVVWRAYTVVVDTALLDTGRGKETLRLVARFARTELPPLRIPAWIDTLELAIEGLQSGAQVENASLRFLRAVFWQRHESMLLRREWQWYRGQPFPPTVRTRLSLVRQASRWILSTTVVLVPSDPSPTRRRLSLRAVLQLSPP